MVRWKREGDGLEGMEKSKSPGPSSITLLLVGLVLLVTAAGGVAAGVPVVSCPRCHGEGGACEMKDGTIFVVPYANVSTTTDGEVYSVVDDEGIQRVMRMTDIRKIPCPRCKGRNRVPLFNSWRRN
jgi:hypothetical protein